MRAGRDCVVVKIGTSSLVNEGKIDSEKVGVLGKMVSAGIGEGLSPVLVTSGAIALGRARHQALSAPTPAARQTAAALGQGLLYSALQEHFASYGLLTAQILLTPFDLTEPGRNVGTRCALDLMQTLGIVPIVNENDALGVRNNDVLAAILSAYLQAKLLLLLTDVSGLYDGNPVVDRAAERIAEAGHSIVGAEAAAAGAGGNGTGGMLVKLSACWIATFAGVRAVIAGAADPQILLAAYRGDPVGTVFRPRAVPGQNPDLGRLWRAFRTPPRGSVVCGQGGLAAVARGDALRRADVTAVRGAFDTGDVVDIAGPDLTVIARGSIRCGARGAGAGWPPDSALFSGSDYVQVLEGGSCL